MVKLGLRRRRPSLWGFGVDDDDGEAGIALSVAKLVGALDLPGTIHNHHGTTQAYCPATISSKQAL
ncbi:hypothetical protein Ddye_019349 [Dipteronia dyeriana]|uniref:Uncharacterized protein n=1 Tax=Dipteronia dyeriana TaxID=168575 RepID=A0AAD9TXL9_9ROSI|nr:hypothetical protein Ddye_019349 [Dipteronia dyeriana]